MMMYVPLILLEKQCWCSEFRLQKEQKDLYMYRQTLLGIPTNAITRAIIVALITK